MNGLTVSLPTPPDFSFAETIKAHGWPQLAPFVWNADAGTLERAERMSDDCIVLMTLRDGFVTVSESVDETELIAKVRRILQLDVPLDTFHAFCQTRPELALIPAQCQGRMLRSPTLFEDVVKVIATVNTTWAQTKAMVGRIVAHFGEPLPQDPSKRTFPTPERIAAMSFDEFAAAARMGYRNAYVYQIATAIANKELALESWQDEPLAPADLRKRLLSLPGIGPYGAACLMLYLGRPEHVNVDSWARTLLGKELGRPVIDKEVAVYFEGYGQWRGLVYTFYPWREADL